MDSDSKIKAWLGTQKLGTKRARILRTCLNLSAAEGKQRLVYAPLDALLREIFPPRTTKAGNDQIEWRDVRDDFRQLVAQLHRRHEKGIGPCPVLRITEKDAGLQSGQWITFVDPGSIFFDDLHLIAKLVRDSGKVGDQPQWNSWIFELYALVYLLQEGTWLFHDAGIISRARDITASEWIREHALATKWTKRRLSKLPKHVNGLNIYEAFKKLERALDDLAWVQTDTGVKPPANWASEYSRSVRGLLPQNHYTIPVREMQTNPPPTEQRTPEHRGLLSVLTDKYPHIFLVGDPGTGKSTLLVATAHGWIERLGSSVEPESLPLLVNLADFAFSGDLHETFAESVCRVLPQVSRQYCRNQVEVLFHHMETCDHKAVWLLDGYNLIPTNRRQSFKRQLDDFLQRYRPHRVVLTGQLHNAADVRPEWPRYMPCSPPEQVIQQYLERQAGLLDSAAAVHEMMTDSHLRTLAKNPFYLQLIAEFLKDNTLTRLPKRRARLLEWMVQKSVHRTRDIEAVPLAQPPSTSTLLNFLESIAFHKIEKGSMRHPEDTAHLWRGDLLGLEQALISCEALGLLASSGCGSDSRVAFVHELFEYFFASRKLMRESTQDPSNLWRHIHALLEFPKWNETLLMFAEEHHDVEFCSQFVLRAIEVDAKLGVDAIARLEHVKGNVFTEIVRRFSYWGHAGLYADMLDGYPVGKDAVRLLRCLEVSILRSICESRTALTWLRHAVLIALHSKSKRDWRDNLQLSPAYDEREILSILAALLCIGESEAYQRSVEIFKKAMETRSRFQNIGPWHYHLHWIFYLWHCRLAGRYVLHEILKPENEVLFTTYLPSPSSLNLELSDIDRIKPLLYSGILDKMAWGCVCLGEIGGRTALPVLTSWLDSYLESSEDFEVSARLLRAAFRSFAAMQAKPAFLEILSKRPNKIPHTFLRPWIKADARAGGALAKRLIAEGTVLTEEIELYREFEEFRGDDVMIEALNQWREASRDNSPEIEYKINIALALLGFEPSRVTQLRRIETTDTIRLSLGDDVRMFNSGDSAGQGREKTKGLFNNLLRLGVWATGVLECQPAMKRLRELAARPEVSPVIRLECLTALERLQKRGRAAEFATDTRTPLGLKPPSEAIAQLEERLTALKRGCREELSKGDHFKVYRICDEARRILRGAERRFLAQLSGWPNGLQPVPEERTWDSNESYWRDLDNLLSGMVTIEHKCESPPSWGWYEWIMEASDVGGELKSLEPIDDELFWVHNKHNASQITQRYFSGEDIEDYLL